MATALAITPSWQVSVRYCTSCKAIYRTDFERCPLDGGTIELSAFDPLVGMSIGAYVIENKIGEGGMGRVYRAHRIDDPTQEVALKVLLGDLAASNVMRQRFAREAQAAQELSHPNIVGVRDYGHTPAGLPYLVMDLVEGTNLAVILNKGPMAGDRVIRIARQLCDALDHAHSRGVIHRDFKPDNILVVNEGPEEQIKVADFGLALSSNIETRLTMTGVACTPAYAAPEQLRGDTIDSRVDLYAMGTTMFEMLTGGMLPFDSDIQGTIRLKLAGEAPSLTTIVPDMQPALATLVGRLLAYDPNRRPRSARSLKIALDAAIKAPKRKVRTEELAPQERLAPVVVFEAPRRPSTKRIPRPKKTSWRLLVALGTAALMIGVAIGAIVHDSEPDAAAATPAPVTMQVSAARIDPVAAPPVVLVTAPAAPVVAPAAPVVAPAAPVVAPTKVEVAVAQTPAPVSNKAEAATVTAKIISKAARPRPKRRRHVIKAASPLPGSATPSSPDDTPPDEIATAEARLSAQRDAVELATQYATVGRELEALEQRLGASAATDLRSTYGSINIQDGVATQDTRDALADDLAQLEAEIADRKNE